MDLPQHALEGNCTCGIADGESCQMECAEGYHLVSGSLSRTCSDGQYSINTAVCQGMTYSEAVLFQIYKQMYVTVWYAPIWVPAMKQARAAYSERVQHC